MSTRGLYTKLLELRESKDLAQYHWSPLNKAIGIIDALSSDVVRIKIIDSLGEEDGYITLPITHLSHIIEDSKDIKQIKQYLIQKSFKL